MSDLYTVTLKFTAVVVASSEEEAHRVAHEERREIAGDNSQRQTELTARPVRSERDLPDGWVDGCLPYCPNDNLTIRERLAARR